MINHKLSPTFIKFSVIEANDPITDQKSFQVDLGDIFLLIVSINQNCQVGNVFAWFFYKEGTCVGLSCDPEGIVGVFAVVLGLEEVQKGGEVVVGCVHVVMLVVWVIVDGVTDAGRGFDE